MSRLALLLALGVSLCGASPDSSGFAPWARAGFPGAEFRWLRSDEISRHERPGLPRRLGFTLIYMRGTSWTQARAIRHVRRTAATFEPCGIKIGSVRLVRLPSGATPERIDTGATVPETGVPAEVALMTSMLPAETQYPVAFLVGRVDGTESLAISYRAADPRGPRAPYFDTSWIGYRAHWMPRRDKGYSALAHELAHLLCRCGHSPNPTRHLLHGARNFLASNVLPIHCRQFAASPLLELSD